MNNQIITITGKGTIEHRVFICNLNSTLKCSPLITRTKSQLKAGSGYKYNSTG